MFGLFKKKVEPFKPDPSALVPRIKHTNFLAAMRQNGIPESQWPYTEPLVADLLVTYAFDVPQLLIFVERHHLQQMALKPGQLRELSLNNMRRQIPKIGLEEIVADDGRRLLHVVTGNCCEACALLASRFWNELATQIPGRMIVAVPNREVVLICSDTSKESMALMTDLAAKAFEDGGRHALTKKLLTWQEGAWLEYNP